MKSLFSLALATLIQMSVAHAAPTPTPSPTPMPTPDPMTTAMTATYYRNTTGTVFTIGSKLGSYKDADGKVTPQVFVTEKQTPALPTAFMGTNYGMIGSVFVTTSLEGYFYKYAGIFAPAVGGGNYFINSGTNELVTVNGAGSYFKTGTKIDPKTIRIFGGNYFLDNNDGFYQIKNDGIYYRYTGMGINAVRMVGGNFLVKQDGTVVTMDETAAIAKTYTPTSAPKVAGGNYFIGQDNKLYTIDQLGGLSDGEVLGGVPEILGYTYIIFKDGSFKVVSGNGAVFSKMIKVATTGEQSELKKIDLKTFDKSSAYVPSQKGSANE